MKFFYYAIILLFCACASSVKPAQVKSTKKTDIKKVSNTTTTSLPAWVINQPQNTNKFIYAIGTASSMAKADENAKAELSYYIESVLTSKNQTVQTALSSHEKESFTYYSNQKLTRLTTKRLHGLSIAKRFNNNNEFYSLATLNLDEVKKFDTNITKQIEFLINSAKNKPTETALKNYFQAMALLQKVVFPIYINNKPVYSLLYRNIFNINTMLKPSIKVIKSKLNESQLLAISFLANCKPLNNFTANFDGKNLTPDFNGKYYLNYNEYKNKKVINASINYLNNFSPSGLSNFEIKDFNQTMQIFTVKRTILIPSKAKKIKAYVSVTMRSDDKLKSHSQQVKRFKTILKKNNFEITDVDYCDINIDIKVDTYLSSKLDDFYVYKSKGYLYINGKSSNYGKFDLNSTDILEKTKVFKENKQIAANKSASLLLQIIEQKLKLSLDKIKK